MIEENREKRDASPIPNAVLVYYTKDAQDKELFSFTDTNLKAYSK